MQITLEKIGKRYRFDWIFFNLSYSFTHGNCYAISGPNGSGKSTLLKVLSGQLTPSRGNISYALNNQPVSKDAIYKQVSIAAPYVELIEEFSLEEMIRFHGQFKSFRQNLTVQEIIALAGLPGVRSREIRFFSSGMKQRVKLLLAILSDTSVLLLDEPSTNLDRQGIQWYESLMERFSNDRIVIIASNVTSDFIRKDGEIHIMDYKKSKSITK